MRIVSGCHTRTSHASFSGFTAWLLWAGIHIYFLIGFANWLLAPLQWAISFVTKRRGVRILLLARAEITHVDSGRQSGPRTSDEEQIQFSIRLGGPLALPCSWPSRLV
jgi:hypothetical protein